MDIADQNYRAFMLQALAKAINDFCMNAIGSPVFGWRDRSVGSKVKKGDQYFWLRVVSENKNWIQKEWWEGNEAANAIKGISKPQVVNRLEWERGEFKLRAELMTFMEGKLVPLHLSCVRNWICLTVGGHSYDVRLIDLRHVQQNG